MDAVHNDQVDLILTSGGTGFTPDDRTPEAVDSLITKRADSLNQFMQAEALKFTPMACRHELKEQWDLPLRREDKVGIRLVIAEVAFQFVDRGWKFRESGALLAL